MSSWTRYKNVRVKITGLNLLIDNASLGNDKTVKITLAIACRASEARGHL